MELDVFVNQLCERILGYMNAADKPGKVVDYAPAESLSKTTDVHLPLEGRGADAVFDDIDEFLRLCVKTNRAEFMNPLWGGLSTTGFAGEVIAALTNTSMYTYELAPFATLIEQAILKRMGELVGFSGGAGTLATGVRMVTCSACFVPVKSPSFFDPSGDRRHKNGCICICRISLFSSNVCKCDWNWTSKFIQDSV